MTDDALFSAEEAGATDDALLSAEEAGMTGVTLREKLAGLVEAASDGEVTGADVLTGASLRALGLTSLGYLRLIDAIETEYRVNVDLGDDPSTVDTVDAVAAQLAERGVAT